MQTRSPRGAKHFPRRASAILAAVSVTVLAAPLLVGAPANAAGRDRTPPTAPTNLRLTGVTETSVSLAWNASTDNSGSVRYIIEMVDRHFSFGPYTGTSGTLNDRTLLPPNTTHRLQLRAYDAALNYSAPSNVITATTLPDTQAPTAPTNGRVVATTPHTVVLSWGPSTDNASWPNDIAYRVSRDGAPVGSSTSLNGRAVRFELRHLPTGVASTFTVRAVDRSGNASAPLTLAVDLPDSADTTPPSAPVLVSGVNADYGEARLTWTASTDDSTAPADLEYEFFVDGRLFLINGGDFVYPVVRGATTGFVAAIGAPGTFTFAVRAVDAAGNVSPPSNALAVTVTTDGY